MPRKLRIQYPGAMYHVMNRGDQREPIFQDDEDRQKFLSTLGEASQKTDWQVHAFCLMNNHYHLVVETPQANLVAGMAWLQSTYTIRLNNRHKLTGHVREAMEAFRRDWCLGSEAFRQEQLERMEGGLGEHHAGALRQESAEAEADRLVSEELRQLGWSAEDLASRRKNDPGKLAIAVRLRRETTLSIKAIAARLHLGTYHTANARLHRAMKAGFEVSKNAPPTLGK